MCNKSNFALGMFLGIIAGAAISCFMNSDKGHDVMDHVCESANDMKHKMRKMAHKAKYKMHKMNDNIEDHINERAEVLREQLNKES